MEKIKEYSNGEITVVWKPNVCIHSGNCVKGSPKVFDPKARPWINMDAAEVANLKATIDTCPSGALSYYMNEEKEQQGTVSEETMLTAQVIENGPLIIKGAVKVIHTDGSEEIKEKRASFCRCGKTGNNPFCDGSHKSMD